ncbi:MAG: transporter [Verrucomicrobia bacterium]|nr:transporter [Verrucomicrobiota bacterium]
MISFYDYLNIAFYVAFIVGVGIFYSRKSKNTSDYFRGGGVMPWWITGAAAWMGSFSAWTFTGAAGKIYETGPYVLCLYFAGFPTLLVLLAYTCYRFRRMRVVTPLEAVRLRFGPVSQQFYTWIRLPFLLFFGGVSLTSVSVFMAAVFGVDVTTMIISLGLIVVIVSMLGGTFAVAASDFVQMFLVVTVTVVTSVLALRQPGVGGVSGLLDKVPTRHFNWGEIARPEFIFLWFIALTANNIFAQNSMENSAKYLMTRSDRHARLMLIIPIVGTLLGPIIWIIPPMVSSVMHHDLGAMFPQLSYPHEAAFLATALDVLPNGMLGLLICGIFAATLTGMDASLNQAAGIYVRNFYLPIVNPQCSEKKLLITSKLCTAAFGAIIITVAIIFSLNRTSGLFDVLNQLGVSLWLPLAVPLSIGLFFKRTPSWSTWTTVLIGLLTAFVVKFFVTPQMFAWIPSLAGPYMPEEKTTFTLFATVAIVSSVCIGWFFFTSLFYERSTPEYKANVEEFFSNLRTPLLKDKDVKENTTIEASIGRLCVIYGAFVTLLVAIPNSLTGRLAFLFCGGVMLGTGLLLVWHYRTKAEKPA